MEGFCAGGKLGGLFPEQVQREVGKALQDGANIPAGPTLHFAPNKVGHTNPPQALYLQANMRYKAVLTMCSLVQFLQKGLENKPRHPSLSRPGILPLNMCFRWNCQVTGAYTSLL